ncbi:MAG: hypothetical protein TEF_20420 [Rhizobiales bacterium NRL2]|jgi:putative endonuclease|nr:MAG: hypothetical protein TEF_20420 [Rhizobiales bacterium NRL2]
MARDRFVYILTDHRNGTFYVGMTNDLVRRMEQHRAGTAGSFSERYGLRHLAWYERHDDPNMAIRREKRIKRWPRAWKLKTIEASNPDWRDLAYSLGGAAIHDCPRIPDPRTRRG